MAQPKVWKSRGHRNSLNHASKYTPFELSQTHLRNLNLVGFEEAVERIVKQVLEKEWKTSVSHKHPPLCVIVRVRAYGSHVLVCITQPLNLMLNALECKSQHKPFYSNATRSQVFRNTLLAHGHWHTQNNTHPKASNLHNGSYLSILNYISMAFNNTTLPKWRSMCHFYLSK